MKKHYIVYSFALAVLFHFSGFAQKNTGGTPYSFENPNQLKSELVYETMPAIDVEQLKAEDEINDNYKDIPWRFGENLYVGLNPDNSGTWDILENGDKVWRLGIQCPGAYTINLTFDNYRLPPGASLYVYNAEKSHVIGAFTELNNQEDGVFATTLVMGDAIVIEYYEPENTKFTGKFNLWRVTHGYRDAYGYTSKAFGSSGACNNNVACPEAAGWEDEIRSAVMLVSGGSGFCSGAMINNANDDGTAYLLTANHCYSDPSSWVFWFNWQSATCANPGSSPAHDQLSGAVLRSRNTDSDFCLVELNDRPQDNSIDVFYSGWNRQDAASSSSVGIHHPSGDIKKISFDTDPSVSSDYDPSPYLANSHWEITAWNDGTTEGGSSGSPLFDQNHRITGQLHGGWASCSSNTADFYGKFSMSWDRGGSSTNQLQNWLDPSSVSGNTQDGYDPGGGGGGYCASTYSNTSDDWISNVTFNTTNNNSGQGGADSYEDYTAISTDIELSNSYAISVTMEMNGNWTEHVWVWIDWNQDDDFDDTGEVFDLGDQTNDGTVTGSITVPAGAILGNTRMRVTEQYNTDPLPCDAHPTTYGETEDYTVNIIAGALPGEDCSNAQDLSTLTSPYSATTTGYNNDFSFCSMGSSPDRIFYIDVPDGYDIEIWQSLNNYDSRHSMRYGGTCPGTTEIDCIDDPDYTPITWTNSTGSTETVWFIVAGYSSNSGDFTLEWTLTAPSLPPVTLPWSEDWESVAPTTTFISNTNGINGALEWDYEKTANGRLQYNVYSHTGSQAAAFDANPSGTMSINYLTANLNIVAYAASTDLELSFWHMMVGEESHANDRVWIRGSNSDPWIQVYDLTTLGSAWTQVSGIDVDAAISGAGQTITSSFQIRFGQEDNYPFTSDGRVFDDILLEESSGVSNDDCANATAINEVTDFAFDTSPATASGAQPSCGGSSTPPIDLWYAYTATFTGHATFDLCGSSYDTRLTIWDACGGNELACNDDACGLQSSITMAVTSGTTYYVQVGGYSSYSGTGDLTIQVANDDCANAIAINEVTDLAFDTSPATASGAQPSCGGSSTPPIDLWYAYTATVTGSATFDLCGSSYDTRLTIWDACGGNELACNDDNGPACSGTRSSITMAVTSGATYYVQVGGYNTSSGTGDLTIQVYIPGLWTGTTSTDWGTTTNWDDGNIPVSSTGVLVPTSPTGGNFPETNTGSVAECADLTIETGAHLEIPSNNTLTVNGVLTNNAGINGLIINSDATGTGSLIHNTAGVDATVERYLIDGRWHFIGIPVSSSLVDVFHLPGGLSDIYLRTHIEATNSWDAYIVPLGTPLTLGRGYETWVGDPAGFSQPETIEFFGTLNTGDFTTGSGGFYGLQFTSGHGLNLIANPYPSAVQGNINTWSKSNLANSIWTWSKSYGNYVYWGSGNDYTWGTPAFGTMTGGVIPAMQGFFVEATGSSPSVTIPQTDRIHSSQAYYKESETPSNTLQLEVNANDYKDVVFVTFNEAATEAYDAYDVKKLFGLQEAPQLYSIISGEQLSINALPVLTEYRMVQLGFECGLPGSYSFTASDFESFNGSVSVYLEDTKLGTMQDLTSNPIYSFTYGLSDELNRFVLHFGNPNGINEGTLSTISIYSNGDMVYVQRPQGFDGIVTIFDMLGQEVINQKTNGEGLISIPVKTGTGYYFVKAQSGEQLVSKKVFIK